MRGKDVGDGEVKQVAHEVLFSIRGPLCVFISDKTDIGMDSVASAGSAQCTQDRCPSDTDTMKQRVDITSKFKTPHDME